MPRCTSIGFSLRHVLACTCRWTLGFPRRVFLHSSEYRALPVDYCKCRLSRCADNIGCGVDTQVSTPRLARSATALHLLRLCTAPTYDHVVTQWRSFRRRQRHLPSEHVNSTSHRHQYPRGRLRSFSYRLFMTLPTK